MVAQLTSCIGGVWRAGRSEHHRHTPADPAVALTPVSQADATLAAEAVDAAAAAQREWAACGAVARGESLRAVAGILEARNDQIARELSREEGKTLGESRKEVELAASIFRYYAAQTLDAEGEMYPSRQSRTLLFTRRQPLGVVSVITPWNFPILIPAWKIAPALAFGNTVVWKPADLVPHTAVHLTEAIVDAGVPDGVLNLVLGRGSEVGKALTTHPQVRAVSFTGSNAVGRGILVDASIAGKKAQLELGGKNPAIVLADAPLDTAVEQIAASAFGGTGQKCTATSRVIVERPVVSEFVDRLVARAETWRAGDPFDPQSTMGPVASAHQLDTVLGFLTQAHRDGAKAVVGGERLPGEGYFVPPTVFVDVTPDQPIVREEIFGPVAAVLPAESYEEALALANDSPYGLSASLYTQDLSRAARFVDDIHAGIVKVNQGTSGVEIHVPFGGTKGSGFGPREQGKAARDFFTESKTAYIGYA